MFENSEVTFSKLSSTNQTWRTKLIPNNLPPPRDTSIDLAPFIGDYIGTHKSQKFWNLAEPGKEKFKSLKAEVKHLLDSHNESLKERESCTVLIELFMIGKGKEKARPTLVVFCTKRGPRKRVVELIQKSGMLDLYCVFLGAASQDPRYPGTVQSVASGPGGESMDIMPHGTAIYTKLSNTKLLCGRSIYVPLEEKMLGARRRFRKATIGGLLNLTFSDGKDLMVGMTVRHAFEMLRVGEIDSQISDESDDNDFEFEFVGPSPEGAISCDYDSSRVTCKF
jgi:hypothetical protein